MEAISIAEKIEMILIYGECHRVINDAVEVYAARFGDNPRSRSSFYRVVNKFLQEGSIQPKKRNRQHTVTGNDNEIAVLAAVNVNPHINTRQIARDSAISVSSVNRILKRNHFHPYHISLHQALYGNDFNNRVTFCQWAHQQLEQDPNFFDKALFSDESSFTNHGEVNRHNMHYYSTENPHWLREIDHQHPWKVNVWCGILGDKLIGPYFIDGHLTGAKYRDFLENELPILLEDVPIGVRQNMWFQNDGCPAHYSFIAREYLDQEFNGRWIGRGGPVNWPARSPDLTSPDFFLWGYLKAQVYDEVPTTRENMIQRIRDACGRITADMLRNSTRSLRVRIEKCIEMEGHHFEHILN